jgi:hypothetical protein
MMAEKLLLFIISDVYLPNKRPVSKLPDGFVLIVMILSAKLAVVPDTVILPPKNESFPIEIPPPTVKEPPDPTPLELVVSQMLIAILKFEALRLSCYTLLIKKDY